MSLAELAESFHGVCLGRIFLTLKVDFCLYDIEGMKTYYLSPHRSLIKEKITKFCADPFPYEQMIKRRKCA